MNLSNLPSLIRSYAIIAIVGAVLWASDMVTYIKVYTPHYLTIVLAFGLNVYLRFSDRVFGRTRILYAKCGPFTPDLSLPVACFFAFEREPTCARLQTFLANFTPKSPTLVDIAYRVDNEVYKVRFDLENEKELLCGEDLPYGEISLRAMPSAYNRLMDIGYDCQ